MPLTVRCAECALWRQDDTVVPGGPVGPIGTAGLCHRSTRPGGMWSDYEHRCSEWIDRRAFYRCASCARWDPNRQFCQFRSRRSFGYHGAGCPMYVYYRLDTSKQVCQTGAIPNTLAKEVFDG